MTLIARVRLFIREHDLLRPESRVALAVSGGSDSMALLHILQALSRAGDLEIAGVIHFNHQLRPTAVAHERFVALAAASCGIPFLCGREDVAARRAREGGSIEKAARRARYAFFEKARHELRADAVALGHTRDDQAETLLLRLLRGAGPRGLAGMRPRQGDIVRPLLDCRRAELRSWLARREPDPSARWVEDESNEDVSIPRNRIRRELLPRLADRFNARIVDVLAREAALQRDVWTWMQEAGAAYLSGEGALNVSRLRRAPPALRRLVVWQRLSDAAGGREISSDHVSAVVRLIESRDGADGRAVDVPGIRVERAGDTVVLSVESRKAEDTQGPASNPANQFSYPLSIPGEVLIHETGAVISAEPLPAVEPGRSAAAGNCAVAHVRLDVVTPTLVVRNRRPGDRFRPVGLCGSKKIQDLFVDLKVPRAERDKVPLVIDESGRIVWVAGYGIDERFRVTDPSQAVLVLRLTRASRGGAAE